MSAVETTADPGQGSAVRLIGRTGREIRESVPDAPDWLIPGVLYPGAVAMVAGREKVGKGTLVWHLLGALAAGAGGVLGAATSGKAVTTLVYTEEPEDSIAEKLRRAGGALDACRFIEHYQLSAALAEDSEARLDVRMLSEHGIGGSSRRAETDPADARWRVLADMLVTQAINGGHGVLYIDNLSRAAGVTDEAGVLLAHAVRPLSEAAKAHRLGVLIDHHHRKAAGPVESMSRGGTALAGAVEAIVDIQRVGDATSRVRKLHARGRLSANNWSRNVELSVDGHGFQSVEAIDRRASEDAAIVEHLRQLGTATAAELATARGHADDKRTRQWLKDNMGGAVEDAGRRGRAQLYRARGRPDC